MANLRPKTTGLPFVVFISQRGSARHAARVKVSPAPRMQVEQTGVYAVRPFRHVAGPRLNAREEEQLARWIAANEAVLLGYWGGDIPFTEDAIEQLTRI